jgi:glycosyltransferase involved in cell wall biosynthesis
MCRRISGSPTPQQSVGDGKPDRVACNSAAVIMRIAQVAPLVESIPPKLYGGTERVVSWLTEELVNAGHQVTLFASGDSTTRAELVPVCQQALRLAQQRTDSAAAHAVLLDEIASRSRDYDVMHCHTEWLHLPLLARATAPFVTTLHGRLDLNGIATVLDRFSRQAFHFHIEQSTRSSAQSKMAGNGLPRPPARGARAALRARRLSRLSRAAQP